MAVKKKLEDFVIGNTELHDLERQVSSFNIFEAIGAVRQELRHSDFLSFILDPAKNHGLDDTIIKKIIDDLPKDHSLPKSTLDIYLMELDGLDVRREWNNIDLLLVDHHNKFLIAIENKIDSVEGEDQLLTYSQKLKGQFSQEEFSHLKIYLTPEGDEPTQDDWINYSYENISKILNDVIESKKTILSDEVITLLQHYNEMLRRHILQNSDVTDLCQKIYKKHKEALDLIFEHRPDVQLNIYEYLKEKIKEKKEDITLEDSVKSYIRFTLNEWNTFPAQKRGKGWVSSDRVLLYEFRNSSNSLNLCLVIGPGDENIRNAIFKKAEAYPDIFNATSNKLSNKFNQIYKLEIIGKKDLDIFEFDHIKEKIDSFFDEEFKKLETLNTHINEVFKKL